jgi:hypothetical protein
MSYTLFIWNLGKPFQGHINFGLDWWTEKEENMEENTYKIISQRIINGQKMICAKKMNKGWCGEEYLGREQISTKRLIFPGLFSIPESDSEWLMSSGNLGVNTALPN